MSIISMYLLPTVMDGNKATLGMRLNKKDDIESRPEEFHHSRFAI